MVQHVDHILLSPFLPEPVVAVLALGHIPFVKVLHHHHQSHLIAEFHQFGSRHVVAGAHGIASHGLEQLQLVTDGTLVDCSPKGTQVVVQADTLEFRGFPVQEESLFRYKFNAAYTETGYVSIYLFVIHINMCMSLVECRILRTPQARVIYHEVLLEESHHPAFHGLLCHRPLRVEHLSHFPFGRGNLCHHTQVLSHRPFDASFQMHRGIALLHMRSGEVGTPDWDVRLVTGYETEMAVESGPRVPAVALLPVF